MTADSRWSTVKRIVHRALELSPGERSRFVARACRNDRALRDEVESLLSYEHNGFLEPPADTSASLPGKTFAHYEIVAPLGSGGMGTVYRARDTRLRRMAALKVLSDEGTVPERFERFGLEAQAASALNHPNIVTIYDVGAAEGTRFIAMELVEGETFRTLSAEGPMPSLWILPLATQIVEGLSKAHSAGIAHRDIKPENLMVSVDGFVKILDFGLAKLLAPDEHPTLASRDRTVTRSGIVLGTVAYMSPEQAAGGSVGTSSDLFSLGSVLYELGGGVRPFERPTAAQTLAAIVESEPVPVRDVAPRMLPELANVIDRLLSKDPDARASSTRELLTELRRISDAHRHDSVPDTCERCCGEITPGMVFCSRCGSRARFSASPPPQSRSHSRRGERREVTIVSMKLGDYTDLAERLPPEAMDTILSRFRQLAGSHVVERGGYVEEVSSAHFRAVFGVPVAREDDARRASEAAASVSAEMGAFSESIGRPLRVKSGLATGATIAHQLPGGSGYRLAGAVVDDAATLMESADDEILVSPAASKLLRPFYELVPSEPLILSEDAAPRAPYRLESATGHRTRLDAAERLALSRYTGREAEGARLRQCLTETLSGTGQFVTVEGSAGIGKSRLLYELRLGLGAELISVQGRCEPYGSTVPYLPFADAVRDLLGLARVTGSELDRRVRRIDAELSDFVPLFLHLLSVRDDAFPPPTHLVGDDFRIAMEQGLSALLTSSARARPVVLFLEDWHWADDPSHAALAQLVELTPGYPLMVVVTSRPEHGRTWPNAENHTHLDVRPLGREGSDRVAESVLGVGSLSEAVSADVFKRTEGNPFFIEEVCRALVETGHMLADDGVAELASRVDSIQIPATVQAVLRARLDRLEPEDRHMLQVGAVIGREFSKPILQTAGGDIDRIHGLKHSGLIQQIKILPHPVYRFKHALTQDVVYESLLYPQRKELHAAVGSAIETIYGERLDEWLDLLAKHFSAAEEWEKAVHYGTRVAERASSLGQFRQALVMLERVAAWMNELPADDSLEARRIELLLTMERTCDRVAERGEQMRLIERLLELARAEGDHALLAEVLVRQGEANAVAARYDEAERAFDAALDIALTERLRAGERDARRGLAFLRWHQGRFREAVALNESVVALSKRLGDAGRVVHGLGNLGAALRSVGELDASKRTLEEALEIAETLQNPVMVHYLTLTLGVTYRDLNRLAEASVQFERSYRTALEHRLMQQQVAALDALGQLRYQMGHQEEGLRLLDEAIEIGRAAGTKFQVASSYRSRGRILIKMKRSAEGLASLRDAARAFFDVGDTPAEAALWRDIAHAEESLEDDNEGALSAWRRFVDLSRSLEALAGTIEGLRGLARAYRKVGDVDGALTSLEEAARLCGRLEDPAARGAVLNTMAVLEWGHARFEHALGHYRDALACFEGEDDQVHAGLMLNCLGATLKKLGRTDEATERFERAVAVHRETGERLLHGHALAALADLRADAGELEAAHELYERSLELRRAVGDRAGEGWMLVRLAGIERALDRPEDASRRAATAESIARAIGDEELLSATTS